jgi:hypothetical protein
LALPPEKHRNGDRQKTCFSDQQEFGCQEKGGAGGKTWGHLAKVPGDVKKGKLQSAEPFSKTL